MLDHGVGTYFHNGSRGTSDLVVDAFGFFYTS
jgi:hypothetical protein